ncbi:MAG: argininosuccinate lyase, partial [Alphaproteobacteria bacterium]|nr:argininosuccinate lyase [Alphaproteobacteria bacterium]
GLPLAYGKDMQEDKEPVFDAEASLAVCLAAMTGMIDDMSVNQQAMRAALASGHPAATDLADYLVSALKMPFRDAHHITGRIVSLADTHHCALDELPLSAMQEIEPRLDESVQTVLSIDHCVAARNSFGGTAPDEVRARIAAARKAFLEG